MKQVLIILFTLISTNLLSQAEFQNGYFIDNSNKKVECLIYNRFWNITPQNFDYKLTESSEVKTLTAKDVKEFGTPDEFKYKSFTINIDKSSDELNNLSGDKKPFFEEELLFLQTIIEGKGILYMYKGFVTRFFFSVDGSQPEQLIFKNYFDKNKKIRQNTQYIQQLWENFKCENIYITDVKNVKYSKISLSKFFILYNQCKNIEFINYEKPKGKRPVNIYIRPGVSVNSLSITSEVSPNRNTDYGNNIGYRLGIEAEFYLPLKKRIWTLIAEPTFQYSEIVDESLPLTSTLNYKYLELNLGVRYNLILNNNNKFFVNALILYDLDLGSNIDFNFGVDLSVKGLGGAAAGVGYKFKENFITEVRYAINRSILSEHDNWESNFQYLSFVVGYKIFGTK